MKFSYVFVICWIGCSVKKPSKLPGEKTVRHDAFLLVQLLIWKTAIKLIRDRCSFIIKCVFNTHTHRFHWLLYPWFWITWTPENVLNFSQKISVRCTIIRSIELILPRKAEYFACRLCQNANFVCGQSRSKQHKQTKATKWSCSQLGSPLSKGQAWGKSWIDLLRVREGWAGHVSLFLGWMTAWQ